MSSGKSRVAETEQTLDVIIAHHHTSNPDRPILLPATGLLSIADHLRRGGVRAQVVHLGVEQRVDPKFDFVAYVRDTRARVVGISAHWFFQLPDSLAVARQLKECMPDTLVVFGGFSASFFAEELIREHPQVDAVVRGDGEVPFLALCRSRLNGLSFERVPNLVFRDGLGNVICTPFSWSVTKDEAAAMRWANLSLLKNHRAFFELPYYPTRKLAHRFKFETDGIFVLNVGRGCPHGCPFCGGWREAQQRINNRSGFLFYPVECVLRSIEEAMEYGYRNFYLSYDPDPSGQYYLDLFDRIRCRKYSIRLMFECWGLPSEAFVEAFSATFDDGLIAVSPDTANEDLRERLKGSLSFTNDELVDRIRYIQEKGLATHVFFGFFLPGDTPETVISTRRFARSLQSDCCETFYLAFSTDPGSSLHLCPDEHDMAVGVRTLGDYLDALERRRLNSNLMVHRPRAMDERKAEELSAMLALEQLVHKLLPGTMRLLEVACGGSESYDETLEGLCGRLAADALQHGLELGMERLAELTKEYVRQLELVDPDLRAAAVSLADFETVPYVLTEKSFGGVGTHYTSACTLVSMSSEQLARFVRQRDVVVEVRTYQHDVQRLVADVRAGHTRALRECSVQIGWALQRGGRYVIFDANATREDPSG